MCDGTALCGDDPMESTCGTTSIASRTGGKGIAGCFTRCHPAHGASKEVRKAFMYTAVFVTVFSSIQTCDIDIHVVRHATVTVFVRSQFSTRLGQDQGAG